MLGRSFRLSRIRDGACCDLRYLMRVNEPITNREVELSADEPLVSRTDPGGRIAFVNHAFREVSGFTEQELIGAPHNLVRHPHMPQAAFADFWATLKAGRPWEGLVKNRTKNGDFYWVRANATPVVENGQVTGYVSVRTKPSRAQVAEAGAVYAQMTAGTAKNIGLRDGQIVRVGPLATARRISASLTGRLAATFGVIILAMILVGGIGLSGMGQSNESLRTVYEDRTICLGQLGEIQNLMQRNIRLLMQIAAGDKAPAERAGDIRGNISRIDKVWQDYTGTYLTPEESALAARFAEQRGRFAQDGLKHAIQMVEHGDIAALQAHINAQVLPLFTPAEATMGQLLDLQLRVAEAEYNASKTSFRARLWTVVAVALICCILAAGLGVMLLRTVQKPLRQLAAGFDALATNSVSYEIGSPDAAEFRPVFNQLRALRARLIFNSNERAEQRLQAEENRRTAVQDMAETVERNSS